MAMGANITGIHNVFLQNAGTSYDFTANATAGMVIHASGDNDTIVAGSASQTVVGSTGNLDVQASAANAGVGDPQRDRHQRTGHHLRRHRHAEQRRQQPDGRCSMPPTRR